MEAIPQILRNGCILVLKDGIMLDIATPQHGEIVLNYRDGKLVAYKVSNTFK